VVELLVHMLQTDPMRRASVADLRDHEWFKKDLPPYLFPESDLNMLIPDEEAIQETCEVSNELRFILRSQFIHIRINLIKIINLLFSS